MTPTLDLKLTFLYLPFLIAAFTGSIAVIDIEFMHIGPLYELVDGWHVDFVCQLELINQPSILLILILNYVLLFAY